ncbi:MAG TPA: S9 family peptidase, partial [Micromonosporaceae bacterium]
SHKDDPDTVAYLTAENDYTDASTQHLGPLREQIFGEIKQRTQETDLSVPSRKGGYWYYTRTVEGQQYGIHCRVPAAPDDHKPPVTDDAAPPAGEQILVDGNVLAEGHDFFSLGVLDVSPDDDWLAYSVDFEGDERFTVHFRNLRTGAELADEIPDTTYGSAWSSDASVFFYTTPNDAWRVDKIWRHVIGTPVADDVVMVEETDERYNVGVGITRSERFILFVAASEVTSEVRYLSADAPRADLQMIAPRRTGVEYHVDHQGDRFLILHNDSAEDFAVATTPVDAPGEWTPLIEHQPGRRLTEVDAFAEHVVVSARQDGLTSLRVLPVDGSKAYDLAFPEPIYTVALGANEEYATPSIRLAYASLITPESVYDCDLGTGELTLLKRKAVLPDAAGRAYDPDDYEQFREWATAADGTKVPLSIVARKGTPRDGSAAMLLYGYGSYEVSIDPYFSIARLSLLDRGVVYAIAHIRGGGEMGRAWYDNGKMLAKKNTFTDFVDCARHVVASGWTSPQRLVARGGSAGGLLMGAIANLAPDAFGGIVAQVPFVDALTTILDPSLPLTVSEWDEWGDPLHDADVYAYMKSYTPYENIDVRPYPPILAMTSLNDTRVMYTEPAKWVARLRATVPDVPVLLKTEMGAGHAGPSGRYNSWRDEAFVLSWLLDRVGLSAA